MDVKVNINLNDILDSIDTKSLEQYIRRRKIQEIQSPGSTTKTKPNPIPMQLNSRLKIPARNTKNDDDIFGCNDDEDFNDYFDDAFEL